VTTPDTLLALRWVARKPKRLKHWAKRWWYYRRIHKLFGFKFWAMVVGAAPEFYAMYPGNADPDTGVPYVVLGFVDRMDLAYSAADAVLCRSGSNTVTEVSGVGLPAIFVPLPFGNGEQALNARAVIEAGGGLLVDDASLTPDWIATYAVPLLTDPARLHAMGAAAAHLIPLDADEKLARMILDAAGGP